MKTKRTGLIAGTILGGTLLLGTAGLALATGETPDELWQPIIATVALIVLALGASVVAFRRQEL